jgi:putative addiction module component (TIGR02574 family)
MSALSQEDIKKLSVAERLELLEKVWDTLVDTPEAVPLTDPQREEIDRRLHDLETNPGSLESWPEVSAYVRDPKRPK